MLRENRRDETNRYGMQILYAFFFLSSAIIEHTNQVIFLEDDDVAAVRNGKLNIHRIKRNFDDPQESTVREIITLKMEIQEIMKGMELGFTVPYSAVINR